MDEKPWEFCFVDLIGPYKTHMKGKVHLVPKSLTMIAPVTGWFEVTQYHDNKVMPITNVVETTWPYSTPGLLE